MLLQSLEMGQMMLLPCMRYRNFELFMSKCTAVECLILIFLKLFELICRQILVLLWEQLEQKWLKRVRISSSWMTTLHLLLRFVQSHLFLIIDYFVVSSFTKRISFAISKVNLHQCLFGVKYSKIKLGVASDNIGCSLGTISLRQHSEIHPVSAHSQRCRSCH